MLGDFPNLEYLYLRFTALNGPIPTALGDLPILYHLHLAATDWTGTIPQTLLDKQTQEDLKLWTNRRPTLAEVADHTATEKHAYRYSVSFSDRDGDALIVRARQAGDGSALPNWLDFDETTGTLSGTPPTVGEIVEVQVIATDEDMLDSEDTPCDPDRETADDETNPLRCAARSLSPSPLLRISHRSLQRL